LSRNELASTVCENLPWKAPNGQLRLQACLPLLEEMAAAGQIVLPPKRVHSPHRPTRSAAQPPPPVAIQASLAQVRPIAVEPVPARENALWNATMAAHHALGFQRAFGAHQRYWIYGQYGGRRTILGGLLFAAAARNVAVRDQWLGWTALQQQRYRYRIVANSRFLILPGVCVPHLASHALALALRRLPADWAQRYGYRPVAVETFVAPPWRGTCYRAANWLALGSTTGTGRQDRHYDRPGTKRLVFVYPLVADFRRALTREASPTPQQLPEPTPPMAGLEPAGGGLATITIEQRLNEMTQQRIAQRFAAIAPFLDEKQRRLLAGAEAIAYGEGGPERVAALVDMAPATVQRGMHELQSPESIEPERVRKKGGGRKPKLDSDPELAADLDRLISPATRGDPESPLRWTCKSLRVIADELNGMRPGRKVSTHWVRDMLLRAEYSLQANHKTREGDNHPDRDAQFEHISAAVQDFQTRGQPVISVDTKKKELVGDFKNAGREWEIQGQPERVRIHDFVLPELGKVSPYGVYDTARNEAWVNVGTDHDTPAFAAASIRGWWQAMGQAAYPQAKELLITADGGGSNSARSRLWKTELQKLADQTGLRISVCHFPPGTSKWNKIEHRLFSYISMNWRGRPLVSYETVVNLIANTKTKTGLKVRCQLDSNPYPTGIKVSDAELRAVCIAGADFHPEWNYTVAPSAA
jgi:hypothetical protein